MIKIHQKHTGARPGRHGQEAEEEEEFLGDQHGPNRGEGGALCPHCVPDIVASHVLGKRVEACAAHALREVLLHRRDQIEVGTLGVNQREQLGFALFAHNRAAVRGGPLRRGCLPA